MKLKDLIYDGSPFLPIVDKEALDSIVETINVRQVAPTAAISFEVVNIGIILHLSHERNFEYLTYQFGLNPLNLTNFFFGFLSGPSLIVASHLLMSKTYQQMSAIMFPRKTDDSYLISWNQYRANLIFDAHPAYLAMKKKLPEEVCAVIWDICDKRAFSDDVYFLAGLESSKRLFLGYAQRIVIKP